MCSLKVDWFSLPPVQSDPTTMKTWSIPITYVVLPIWIFIYQCRFLNFYSYCHQKSWRNPFCNEMFSIYQNFHISLLHTFFLLKVKRRSVLMVNVFVRSIINRKRRFLQKIFLIFWSVHFIILKESQKYVSCDTPKDFLGYFTK